MVCGYGSKEQNAQSNTVPSSIIPFVFIKIFIPARKSHPTPSSNTPPTLFFSKSKFHTQVYHFVREEVVKGEASLMRPKLVVIKCIFARCAGLMLTQRREAPYPSSAHRQDAACAGSVCECIYADFSCWVDTRWRETTMKQISHLG